MNHRHLVAAKLGYTGKFRINESIEDIKKIKKLCDEHHIKLTAFMYPSYYKTYLFYDQSKIETFKRKLVDVIDFYDFYEIGPISLDQHNWFEGSHFVTSIGDYIIDSIHKHKRLVTKNNIEERIRQTRALLKNMPILADEDIYLLNENTALDASQLKTIFDLKDKHFSYSKNDQFTLMQKNEDLHATVDLADPFFILDTTHATSKQAILLMHIKSPKESLFQLYLKKTPKSTYAETSSFKLALHKGDNYFRIVLTAAYINNGLRVDFTRNSGDYVIKEFMIKALKQ